MAVPVLFLYTLHPGQFFTSHETGTEAEDEGPLRPEPAGHNLCQLATPGLPCFMLTLCTAHHPLTFPPLPAGLHPGLDFALLLGARRPLSALPAAF